jgi:alpha-glucosidase
MSRSRRRWCRIPPAVNQPEIADIVGRDPERTPMQWDASPNAGFAAPSVRTWLPLAADYATRNVAIQSKEPTSMLSFYRALTGLRQAEPALTIGAYRSVDAGAADVFAYLRSHDATRLLVVLNFGGEARRLDLSAVAGRAELLLSTEMTAPRPVALTDLTLGPNEGLILLLKNA